MKKFKHLWRQISRQTAQKRLRTNKAGVMNYDVIAYGSVCRDVKVHDLPVLIF
jgi:hypothetical protein